MNESGESIPEVKSSHQFLRMAFQTSDVGDTLRSNHQRNVRSINDNVAESIFHFVAGSLDLGSTLPSRHPTLRSHSDPSTSPHRLIVRTSYRIHESAFVFLRATVFRKLSIGSRLLCPGSELSDGTWRRPHLDRSAMRQRRAVDIPDE